MYTVKIICTQQYILVNLHPSNVFLKLVNISSRVSQLFSITTHLSDDAFHYISIHNTVTFYETKENEVVNYIENKYETQF